MLFLSPTHQQAPVKDGMSLRHIKNRIRLDSGGGGIPGQGSVLTPLPGFEVTPPSSECDPEDFRPQGVSPFTKVLNCSAYE